jgi:CHRD domain-containing protein
MKRVAIAVVVLGLGVAGCSGSSTSPSNQPTVFTVNLLPQNEVPPVSNSESSGHGTAVIVFNTVRDSSGTITSATADFNVSLTGFPAGTTAIAAHIHPGSAGAAGNPLVGTPLSATSQVVLTDGSGTFSFTGVTVPPDVATQILGAPQNFYFNVHSTTNRGGFARGQLR